MKSLKRFAFALAALAVLSAPALAATAADFGAAGALAALGSGASLTVTDMLRYAVEDEYLARAEYRVIMAKFGAQRPYANIEASENQHLDWLRAEYALRGLAFPADAAASKVAAPADLKAAAQAGVDAEIGNIAMYEAFLASPLMAKPENASVAALFGQLKRASENHLRAFRTQLARFP